METAQRRQPRFIPVETDDNFAYTQRIFSILYSLYRYQVLTTFQLVALAPGSEQKTRKKLKLLFNSGLITKFNTKTDLTKPGSEPDVYALTDQGARLLADEFNIPRRRSRYNENNKRRSLQKIKHDLMVSEIMVRFEVAALASSKVTFINQESILKDMPAAKRGLKYPLTWRVPVAGHAHGIGTNPDHVFGIHDSERPEGKDRAFFFVEADTGSEVNIPKDTKNLERTTIYKKLVTYAATHTHRIHREHFGIPNFRVLFVTLPAGRSTGGCTRAENMMQVAKEATEGKFPELFLFADYETFRLKNPLDFTWRTFEGKERSIIST